MAMAPQDPKPPLDDVLQRLLQNRDRLIDADPGVERPLRAILNAPSEVHQDTLFRTRVAYVVQDAERLVGPLVAEGPLRQELSKLATTFPGLQNERVGELLRQTPEIDNREIVRSIRSLAMDTARLGDNQDTPAINQRVDAIEAGLRPSRPRTEGAGSARATQAQGVQEPTPLQPDRSTHTQPEHGQAGAPLSGFRQQASPTGPGEAAPARPAPPDQSGATAPRAPQDSPDNMAAPAPQRRASVGDTLASMLHAMTSREPLRQADADAAEHTPMRDRIAGFREHHQAQRDEQQIQITERAGSAAIADMKAFTNGPGSTIMNKIREASASDPDGTAGVLAGMRAGGKYEDLGQQLQRERTVNPVFAASQDKAAESLAAYGQAREAATSVGQRRGEQAVNGRLEQLDAAIGAEASAIPGRRPGDNLLDEIAEKIRELIQRASERISSAFSARSSASAGPSPAP